MTAVILGATTVLLRASSGLPFVDSYTVYLDSADARNLRANSRVDIAGKRVGRVVDTWSTDGGRARVEIRLDPDVEPLPADTTAVIRAQGLLGARFVELRPGDASQTLADGDTIRGGELTNGVPEALLTFDAKTREALVAMVDGLGRGVLDRGRELNETFGTAPELVRDVTLISRAIARRSSAARRLLPSLEAGMSALSAARDDIAGGLRPTAEALAPFVDRRAAVHATLEQAPPTLAAARAGLDEGRALLAAARDLSVAVSDVLPAAPPGLRQTTRLLSESPEPLRRTASLLREARPTVPALLRVTGALDPVLEPLERALADLRPIVARLGVYGCDVDNWTENWRSMLGYGVKGGGEIGPLNSLRFEPIASGESVAGVGPTTKEALQPDFMVVREPYPAPCKYSPGGPYGQDRLDLGTGPP